MERFPIPPTEYNTGKLFNTDTLPPSYASFSSNPQLRDFSFSSFLEPIPDNQPAKHTATATSTLPGRTSDDLEISIFSAEKYFNTSPEHAQVVLPVKKGYFWNSSVQKPPRYPEFPQYPTTKRASSVSSAEGYGRNYRCTPTSTSEASWNSQSGLLTNPPGSIPFSLREAPDRKSTGKWRFGRKCPCLGKKSIEVDDNYVQTPKTLSGQNSPKFLNCRKPADSPISPELHKTAVLKGKPLPDGALSGVYEPQIRYKGESGRHVSLPGMNYRREDPNLSFPAPTIPAKLPADELGRKSLEVFRGHAGPTGLLMIEDRRNLVLPGGLKDDDACSDASSDLFEIESFSTATTSYRRTPRHSIDDLASDVAGPTSIPAAGMYHGLRRSVDTVAAPSECAYAPSEVSVEWSVTTAEGGFDHASFANFSTTGASESGGDIGRRSDHAKEATALAKKGDLFGCHSQKSVSVFVPPVRNPPVRNLPDMRAPTALGMAKRSDGRSLDVVDPSHVRKGVYRPSILRPHYPQVIATRVSS